MDRGFAFIVSSVVFTTSYPMEKPDCYKNSLTKYEPFPPILN